jgi:epoxyqueuosine reductase
VPRHPLSASDLSEALTRQGLTLLGSAPPDPAHMPPGTQALALIGPMGGSVWWDIVTASPEWTDGAPDPVDRWSRRVLDKIAQRVGATALYPFGGPPWMPFQTWAQATGRVWESPVRLLVHAEAGLWVSFRGALALPFALDLPPLPSPCETCADRPCLTACPPRALTGAGYDLPACHAFLDTPAGETCRSAGCRVRAACPVSVRHARVCQQSAYHMSRFHP